MKPFSLSKLVMAFPMIAPLAFFPFFAFIASPGTSEEVIKSPAFIAPPVRFA